MNRKEALTIWTFFAIMAVTGFNCSDDAVTINGGDHQYHIGVVSTEWLESNLNMKDLLIVDVRSAEAFSSGHIENSINIPFNVVSDWTVMKGDLLLEVPEISQLAASLGQNGISRNNKVVLVGGLPTEQDPFALASPTRVALTMAYAGIQNLAILDGCFNKWQDEGRSITTATTVKAAVSFEPVTNNMIVDINYLKSKKDVAIIVDARDANVYSGEVIEAFADKAGHIPGAVSLPAPSLWNDKNGTYKTRNQIATLAKGVVGQDKNKEIILYCGVGGYASSVWFALTQILDYKNVKVYDGAAQEWVMENEMECSAGINCGAHQFTVGVVNTEWLESNLTMKDLLIVDVRSAEAFSNGHIENSINIPFNVVSDWTVMKGDLLLEVPEISQLAASLGQNGISRNNKVVLVGGLPTEQDPFALAAPTRVALTMAYAGVQNLAILDGCFNKWQDEGRSITTATTVKAAVSFEPVTNNMIVDINYLKSKKDVAVIVDARDANVYSGEAIEQQFADKAGHIPGAFSLPAPSLWNDNGTYKTKDQIATLANSVLGQDKNKEIILYCGVGGYASSVWFALTQILDYKNVKVYDGAAQEWVMENEMECSAGINCGAHQFTVGVVNTEWLESNLTMKDLLIVDVRSAEAFSNGHIENSINIPFDIVSDWTVMKGDLLLEVPEISQLAASLGQNGISKNNKVVLVGGLPTEQDPFALAAPTRVALTMAYAGVQNLAILDGCFNKWQDEGRRITTEATVKTAVSFEPATNNMIVDINYLKSKKDVAVIVDARDANVYSGEAIEQQFADKAGHIPGAVSLPAPSLWNDNGTYKTKDQIATLASSVVGQDKNKEIILYCGVGGYASSVWFALTQILDYKNVKVYDGAAQEWVKENEMELSSGL